MWKVSQKSFRWPWFSHLKFWRCLAGAPRSWDGWSFLNKETNRILRIIIPFRCSAPLARSPNVLCLMQYTPSSLLSCQFGFRKKDSTSLQLFRLLQQCSEAVDKGCYVGVIFFDLQKAFDKVWHAGLLAKLELLGIRGDALSWFESYLSGRSQCTDVAGVTSQFADLHAGVPQGAILSPLLFTAFVNDLPQHVSTADINLFADDTSASVRAKTASTLADGLRTAVAECSVWFDRWFLTVNNKKMEFLVIQSKKMESLPLSLKLNGTVIPQVATHKHLGLHINELLSWSDHAWEVCTSVCRKIGLLRRLHCTLGPLIIRQLYCSSIWPAIEYASLTWCGMSQNVCQSGKSSASSG